MTAAMPNAMSNKILNFLFTGGSTPLPSSVYLALSTSSPGAAGSIAGEPTIGSGSYARVQIAQSTAVWSTAASGQITNGTATISFPQSTAAWSTGATALTYAFLIDASTGAGTLGVIAYAPLTPATDAVNASGITITVPLSSLTFTLA
jgi:hypothetical protein